MYELRWKFDSARDPTNGYTIFVSRDGGQVYSALDEVPFSVTGPNYDKATNEFFYVDPIGAPGNVYELFQPGAPSRTFIAPPEPPPTCIVFGYSYFLDGSPARGVGVSVGSVGRSVGSVKVPGILGSSSKGNAGVMGSLTTSTNEDGFWSFKLMQGARVVLVAQQIDLELEFTVPPFSGPLNVLDIQQHRGTAIHGSFDELTGVPVGLDGT